MGMDQNLLKCHSSQLTSIKTSYNYPGYPENHPAQAQPLPRSLRGTLGRFRIVHWYGSRPFQVHVDGPQIPHRTTDAKDVENLLFITRNTSGNLT